jgi:chitin disaccharide deacetylase
LIICADDYGLSPDIDEAILDLLKRGSLSAVSCLVVLPGACSNQFKPLLEFKERADLGLHFALIVPPDAGWKGNFQALPGNSSYAGLVRSALLGRVNLTEVKRALEIQYDTFVQQLGKDPDFIDSHLHVHQLPGIREALLGFVQSIPEKRRPYLRNTAMGLRQIARQGHSCGKCAAIGWFGRQFQRQLKKRGLTTNQAFSGVYNFSEWSQYAARFPCFMEQLSTPNGLLMTHPGFDEPWRRAEYEVLKQHPHAQQIGRYKHATVCA